MQSIMQSSFLIINVYIVSHCIEINKGILLTIKTPTEIREVPQPPILLGNLSPLSRAGWGDKELILQRSPDGTGHLSNNIGYRGRAQPVALRYTLLSVSRRQDP